MVKSRLSIDVKIMAIEYYYKKNCTLDKVADIFKINEKTLRRWISKYEKNKLETSHQTKKSYKIKQKHVNYALKILNKTPTLSISMLWKKIKSKYNDFDITETHLSRVIRDNNFTRKRTKIRHYPETRYNKPIDFVKEMKAFYKITDKYSIHKIISVDETSIHAQITGNYSRCKLGKRCVKKTTNNAVFKKYTLVCAINSFGVVGFELYENGGMNLQRMKDFLKKNINHKYKNNLIIMDNGGSHKSKEIRKYIEENGNKLQYSVPYRPKTNAIENYFSQLKYYFGYEIDKLTYIGLKNAVVKAMKKIKKINYLNYMKYSYNDKVPFTKQKEVSKHYRKPKLYSK